VLRTPRLSVLLLPALLAVTLTACGSDAPPAPVALERLDAVEIAGDIGAEPTVTWSGEMDASEIASETLITGSGPALKDKDEVLAHLWIGNGFAQDKAFSTFDDDAKAELLVVDEGLPPFLAAIKGATVGSRVVVTSSAEEAFGEAGNSSLGIGNKDSVLVIIDLVATIPDGPRGSRRWSSRRGTRPGSPSTESRSPPSRCARRCCSPAKVQ
jgi:peptidylprolyl isomerase